jgi:hypothetical protein
VILNRITDQVLEKLRKPRLLAEDGRQIAAGHRSPTLLDCPIQILGHLLKNFVEIDGFASTRPQ